MRLVVRIVCAPVLAAVLFAAAGAVAQDRGVLEYTVVEGGAIKLPANPSRALLIVESTVDLSSIDSERGVFEKEQVEPGVWHVKLEPGPQMVTIRAEGFLPLELPPRPAFGAYPRGEAHTIRVFAFGARGGFDRDRPALRLVYAPVSPDEQVLVQLDDNPPQLMDFSGGSVGLRPSAGEHTVRVFAGGRVWESPVALASGESDELAVDFDAGAEEALAEVQPGNLYIETDPPGATVILNQVEQQGVTPLSLNDLRPGTYEIELVRDLYLPATRVVEVRELDYTNVRAELTPNFGRVSIDSDPPGALVFINDTQRGTTPLEIPRFNAGQYRLRLVRELYHEQADTFRIEPGGEFARAYDLKPRFGSVTVTSTPPGADVEVDGESWGVTPATREQVASGTHLVRVSKENYYPQEKEVDVFDGVHREMPFQLSASVGFLTVESDPPGATVTDVESGEALGTTPLDELPLAPGTYTLRIELDDYETVERTAPVSLAGAPAVHLELARRTGHLRVETTPARATVILDGERRGTTPAVVRDLPTGSHELRIEKPGYDTQLATVTVRHNQVSEFSTALGTAGTKEWLARRRTARIASVIPGGGQFMSEGQTWRGALYAGGIAAAGLFAWQAKEDYTAAEQDYDAAITRYNGAISQSEMDRQFAAAEAAYDEMDTSQRTLTLSLAAAGAVYAVSIADAWLFGGGPKPVAAGSADAGKAWTPWAASSPSQFMVGIRFRL